MLITLTSLTLAACGGGEGSDGVDSSANLPPIIAGSPVTTLSAGSAYAFTPTAADPDGDPIVFRATNVPAWASFSTSTGALTGTPTEANVGMTDMIHIEVTDSKAVTLLTPFRIQVTSNASAPPPSNVAPTIAGNPATIATVGQPYTFLPVGDDANDDNLTYSIQNAPSWITFTPSTGRLSGTPTSANVGTSARITITVSDGTATASLPSFTIQVTAPGNRPPTISGTPATSLNVLAAYTFQPSASDPDGNLLTFRIDNRPSWLTFNTSNGQLSGTPSVADVGTFSNIMISVTDGTASASLPAFSIAVVQSSNGTAVVRWTAPTTNADGSPLTNLAGYRVTYGRSSNVLDQTTNVDNPGLTTYTVTNLSSGQWYFAVYAVNAAGGVSEISNLATKYIP